MSKTKAAENLLDALATILGKGNETSKRGKKTPKRKREPKAESTKKRRNYIKIPKLPITTATQLQSNALSRANASIKRAEIAHQTKQKKLELAQRRAMIKDEHNHLNFIHSTDKKFELGVYKSDQKEKRLREKTEKEELKQKKKEHAKEAKAQKEEQDAEYEADEKVKELKAKQDNHEMKAPSEKENENLQKRINLESEKSRKQKDKIEKEAQNERNRIASFTTRAKMRFMNASRHNNEKVKEKMIKEAEEFAVKAGLSLKQVEELIAADLKAAEMDIEQAASESESDAMDEEDKQRDDESKEDHAMRLTEMRKRFTNTLDHGKEKKLRGKGLTLSSVIQSSHPRYRGAASLDNENMFNSMHPKWVK
jgi:hypothetical protein